MEYLERYNKLPLEIRLGLAQVGVISAIKNLEAKYGISLALTVIKAAIGELDADKLVSSLMADLKIDNEQAIQLAKDLRQSVFFTLPAFSTTTPRPTAVTAGLSRTSVAQPTLKPSLSQASQVQAPTELDAKIIDIINKAKIDLASQVLTDRLKQVIKTYLLGVRDKLAVKDALTRAFEMGGLSFSAQVADELIKIADGSGVPASPLRRPSLFDNSLSAVARAEAGYNLEQELKARGQAQAPIDPMSNQSRLAEKLANDQQQKKAIETVMARSAVPANLPWNNKELKSEAPNPLLAKKMPMIQLQPANMKAIEEAGAKVRSLKQMETTVKSPATEQTPTAPVSPMPLPVPRIKDQEIIVTAVMPVQSTPAPEAPTAVERYQKTDSGKIKMDDIHFTPRVFTPIDELKYLTLKNFRNLSSNPTEAAMLVKRKIETLSKEEYSWKLEGVQAFKQSPVNCLYVEIYHTAMSQGKQITAIIAEKRRVSDDALTEAEFEALSELNQTISMINT